MASAGLSTTTPAQVDPVHPGRALPDAGHAPSNKPPKGHLHHHDDVWNADSTFALLQSWGGRFLELNQGCLSRADWSYVTQQVLLLSGKTSLTETQCRNRIDTLKKKYKREKHKLATMGGGFSSWPYYQHLDAFLKPAPMRVQPIVALPAEYTSKMNALPVAALPQKMDPQPAIAPAAECVGKMDPCVEKGRIVGQIALNNASGEDAHLEHENQEHDAANIVSASCEVPDSSEMSQSSFKSSDNEHHKDRRKAKRQRRSGDACFGVIAKALTKFADVYERIETAKQQQALDLEKTRMEVTRNFELQKWRLLMQTQMELAKIKGGTNDGDHCVDDIGANLFATCFMPLEYC